jgi:exonuclease SbcC
MVPTRLTLENFLSYRERQTLKLRELDLACLSGENGHGKSALLDAITWALWGEARKPSSQGKPDDTLLNNQAERAEGATEMEVALAFEVGGDRYNVIRSYRKTASGKTTSGNLRFFSVGETGQQELTASTMRDTQSLIDETVGTEYSTFINTSFLLQGRSDELTQKRPAERKEVLANVLRLGRFDRLGEACLEERRQVNSRVDQAESKIEMLQESLEGADERKQALEKQKSRLSDLQSRREELEERRSVLREERSRAESAKEKAEDIRGEISGIEQEISSLEDDAQRLGSKIEEGETVEAKAEQIREDYARYQDLQNRLQSLQSKQDEYYQRQETLREKKDALQEGRQAAESRRHSAEDRLENIKSDLRDYHSGPPEEDGWDALAGAAISSLEQDLQEAKARRDAIEEAKAARSEEQNALSEVEGQISDIRSELSVLRRDKEQRESDIQELNDIDGNRCPRCGSEVSEEHIMSEINDARSDITELKSEIKGKENELESLTEEKESLQSSISDLEEHLEELRGKPHPDPIQDDLSRARNLQAQAKNTAEILSMTEEELMREEEYSPSALKQELQEAQQEAEEVGFDQDELNEVRSELDELSGIADEKTELERALDKLGRWREKLDETHAAIAEKEKTLSDLREEKSDLEEQAAGLSTIESNLEDAQESLGEVESDIQSAQQEIGRLENQIETDETNRESLREKAESLSDLEERQRLLEHLREAFSKHGIPSLIIESAIPDLEDRANRLLGRLTDGMSLRLETTRETQSGDTTDTLQILIEDESGATRPYESFSGGEGFRVDFALRVALSQLLARRSGAPLRTLVIDEGFGTQDDNGLRAVKQAISEVADDFELVLVITHLEELKDAFPQRVEVEKTPGRGSTFTVHE